jgi:hypothetical protein
MKVMWEEKVRPEELKERKKGVKENTVEFIEELNNIMRKILHQEIKKYIYTWWPKRDCFNNTVCHLCLPFG